MIFQDPMMTLNPVLRIDTQMVEAILAHDNVSRTLALARARDALVRVGIPSPDERLRGYPHQFSGGMRQRVAIAIALLNEPDLIIADEPTTALDVTIQGQILYEMQKLSRETGAALLWITHDLSVVAGLADRICVMYAGRVVEEGTAQEVLGAPRHPYTRGLLDSVPGNAPAHARLKQIPGMTPSLLELPRGLPVSFALRIRRRRMRTEPADASHRRGGPSDTLLSSAARGDRMTSARADVPLLELRSISKRFVQPLDVAARIANWVGADARDEVVHAVDRVDLRIREREVVGLVGESGCGKSTLGRLAVGLLAPSNGKRFWRGASLDALAPGAAREQQLKTQMIFQDPYASLNPRRRVVDIVGEAPVVHGMIGARQMSSTLDSSSIASASIRP